MGSRQGKIFIGDEKMKKTKKNGECMLASTTVADILYVAAAAVDRVECYEGYFEKIGVDEHAIKLIALTLDRVIHNIHDEQSK